MSQSDYRAEVQGEEESAHFVLPMRYLGMGLFIAWLCCTHIVDLYPGPGATVDQRDAITLGMRYGDVATLALLALLAPRIGSLGNHLKLCGALALATSVGTALCAWALPAWGVSLPVFNLTGALTAIGGAVLFCLWGQVYCRLSPTRIIVYGSASYVFSSVTSFVIYVCTPPFAVAFTSALPVLSFAFAYLSLRSVSKEPSFSHEVRYPIPWKLVAIATLAAFISVTSGALLPNLAGGSVLRNAATGACGLLLFGLVFFMRDRFDLRLLARIAFPLVFVTVLLIPFARTTLGLAVSFTGKLSYVWFYSFVLVVLCGVCRRYAVPSLRMFASVRACSEAALLVGVLAKSELANKLAQNDPAFQVAFVVLGLVALGVSLIIWMKEPTVNSDWGAAGIVVETGLPEENETIKFQRRLEELTQAHDLTAREAEIMAFIAQGKTRSEICAELFLSENTVKTHARNLYRKLGVHAKSEVPPLFQ